MNLKGNTIFITGGGSGIGRGLAEAFHNLGNQVIISGRRKSYLDDVITANPGMAAYELDITDVESINSVTQRIVADYPDLNVLVNNAGIMTHDYYRPYYYDRVAAGLDKDGRLIGRTHRVTGSSIFARWAPAAFKNGVDPDAVDCASETPYDEEAVFADYVRDEPAGVNTSWWRGVGASHNLFVVESFVDEMATATKQDPLEFRRKMLTKNPRALAVLNLAAEKAGWVQACLTRNCFKISSRKSPLSRGCFSWTERS